MMKNSTSDCMFYNFARFAQINHFRFHFAFVDAAEAFLDGGAMS